MALSVVFIYIVFIAALFPLTLFFLLWMVDLFLVRAYLGLLAGLVLLVLYGETRQWICSFFPPLIVGSPSLSPSILCIVLACGGDSCVNGSSCPRSFFLCVY